MDWKLRHWKVTISRLCHICRLIEPHPLDMAHIRSSMVAEDVVIALEMPSDAVGLKSILAWCAYDDFVLG